MATRVRGLAGAGKDGAGMTGMPSHVGIARNRHEGGSVRAGKELGRSTCMVWIFYEVEKVEQ